MLTIYHNGECSKSKGALELLIENNIPHRVRYYLAEPLTKTELQVLLQKLGLQPAAIVRKNELLYKEQYQDKDITDDEWLDILVNNPELIERPIVETADTAFIARPPEKVLDILIDK